MDSVPDNTEVAIEDITTVDEAQAAMDVELELWRKRGWIPEQWIHPNVVRMGIQIDMLFEKVAEITGETEDDMHLELGKKMVEMFREVRGMIGQQQTKASLLVPQRNGVIIGPDGNPLV